MFYKFLYFLFSIKVATCSCRPEIKHDGFVKAKKYYTIKQVGQLPKLINESSGLARSTYNDLFWTHNDGGGKAELYLIDYKGLVHKTLALPDSKNIDWEDLSQDTAGNIYIGDFGNNSNTRRDLAIYKSNEKTTSKISFSYSNQIDYPPKKADKNFDCEAFFWFQNNLYLFSKNRGNNVVKCYVVPDMPNNYEVLPVDSIYIKSQITAADISPDNKSFVLLGYGKLLFFDIINSKIDFSHPTYCLKIARNQAEAIIFVNNNDLLITNEQGKIFLISKK